jgi:hypothetical protein
VIWTILCGLLVAVALVAVRRARRFAERGDRSYEEARATRDEAAELLRRAKGTAEDTLALVQEWQGDYEEQP